MTAADQSSRKTTAATENRVPKISIGLPVYNGERYLREALDALLSQTLQDFELIIRDNASTDATEQICREYAAKDSRIRYIRNPANVGAPRNFWLALEPARASYFRWATCDDRCEPRLLELCVAALDAHPDVVMAYPKTILIGEDGQVISDFEDQLHLQGATPSERFITLTKNLRLANCFYGVMRTDVLRKTKPMGRFIAADIPFLAELSLRGKFYEVPEHLFRRRLHPGAYSSSKTVSKLMEWCDPRLQSKVVFAEWRHIREYVEMSLRVPMSPMEKARVFSYALRMGLWRKDKLARELVLGARYMARRLKSSIFTASKNAAL